VQSQKRRGMEVWRFGGELYDMQLLGLRSTRSVLETRCGRTDSKGAEVRSSGGTSQARRHGEVWRPRGLKVWRYGGTLQARRCGGSEVWRIDKGVATWRYGGVAGVQKVKAQRYRVLEERCRRVNVETWSYGVAV